MIIIPIVLGYVVVGGFVAMPMLEWLLRGESYSVITKSCLFWLGALSWPVGVPAIGTLIFVRAFMRRIFS